MELLKALLHQFSLILLFSLGGFCIDLPKCCLEDNHTFQDGKCVLSGSNSTQRLYTTLFADFNFIQRKPNCNLQDLNLVVTTSPTSNKTVNENHFVTGNGYFKHGQIYYPPNDFCIERIQLDKFTTSVSAFICSTFCDERKPCFPKCCPPDEILVLQQNDFVECSTSGQKFWWPLVYNKDDNSEQIIEFPHFLVTGEIMSNEEGFGMYPSKEIPKFREKSDFRITKNGVEIRESKTWAKITQKYCMDGMILPPQKNSTEENITNDPARSNNFDMTVILYDVTENIQNSQRVASIYKIAFFISSTFLLLNICVYISLWETRKSVYWLTQLSHFMTLLFMYIFLALAFIQTPNEEFKKNEVMSTTCFVIGILAHFFFLSTFCWLLMINTDLYCRFGHTENMIAIQSSRFLNRSGVIKFKKYFWFAGFALGVPSVIVGTGVALDVSDFAKENEISIPNYGREKCYVRSDALFIYLYAPIALILALNVMIYIATVISVIRFKRNTLLQGRIRFVSKRSAKATDQRTSDSQQSLCLFTKLFLLMGVPWVFEVIGWAYGSGSYFWNVLDLLNIFQCILIFFIFVCKEDIVRELRAKFICFDRMLKKMHVNFGEQKSLSPPRAVGGVAAKCRRFSYPSSQGSRSSDFSSTSTRSFALSDVSETTFSEIGLESTRL